MLKDYVSPVAVILAIFRKFELFLLIQVSFLDIFPYHSLSYHYFGYCIQVQLYKEDYCVLNLYEVYCIAALAYDSAGIHSQPTHE